MLLGPLNVLVTAIVVFGIPEIARGGDMSVRRRQRFCWALSGGVTVVCIAYSCVVLLLPDGVGRQLFGDSWAGAQTVLLAMCVLYLAVAIGVGPGVTLFGMGRARASFTLNLVKAPLLLLALPLGIWQFGPVGAAWGLALTESVMLPLLIIAAVRAMRGRPGTVGSTDAAPGSASASPVTESVTVSSTLLGEDRPDAGSSHGAEPQRRVARGCPRGIAVRTERHASGSWKPSGSADMTSQWTILRRSTDYLRPRSSAVKSPPLLLLVDLHDAGVLAEGDRTGGHVLHHEGVRSDPGVVADPDCAEQGGSGAQLDAATHGGHLRRALGVGEPEGDVVADEAAVADDAIARDLYALLMPEQDVAADDRVVVDLGSVHVLDEEPVQQPVYHLDYLTERVGLEASPVADPVHDEGVQAGVDPRAVVGAEVLAQHHRQRRLRGGGQVDPVCSAQLARSCSQRDWLCSRERRSLLTSVPPDLTWSP